MTKGERTRELRWKHPTEPIHANSPATEPDEPLEVLIRAIRDNLRGVLLPDKHLPEAVSVTISYPEATVRHDFKLSGGDRK